MEGIEAMGKIVIIFPQTPNLKHVYTFIDRIKFPFYQQLIELGKSKHHVEEFEKRKSQVKTSGYATIIYTPGTTGTLKGIMLSHSNIINQLFGMEKTPAKWSNIASSFLPLCHAYERMLVFMYQYLGMSVYYAQNLGTIVENIKKIKPTMMTTVLRILEKIYDKIYVSSKSMPLLKKKIFRWGLSLVFKYKIQDHDRT